MRRALIHHRSEPGSAQCRSESRGATNRRPQGGRETWRGAGARRTPARRWIGRACMDMCGIWRTRQVLDSATMAHLSASDGGAANKRSLDRNVYATAAVSFFNDASTEMIY